MFLTKVVIRSEKVANMIPVRNPITGVNRLQGRGINPNAVTTMVTAKEKNSPFVPAHRISPSIMSLTLRGEASIPSYTRSNSNRINVPYVSSNADVNIAAVMGSPVARKVVYGIPAIWSIYLFMPSPIPARKISGSRKGGRPLLMRLLV